MPVSCIVLHLNALKTPRCEWIQGCSDMSDLRYFCKIFAATLWTQDITGWGVNIPQIDSPEKLSSDDIMSQQSQYWGVFKFGVEKAQSFLEVPFGLFFRNIEVKKFPIQDICRFTTA